MSLVNHQEHLLTEFILKGLTCHVDIFGDWLYFQFMLLRRPYYLLLIFVIYMDTSAICMVQGSKKIISSKSSKRLYWLTLLSVLVPIKNKEL